MEITLQRYGEFQPTAFDARGLNGERHGIAAWYVAPVMLTRDSEAIDRSNFRVMLRELGGESATVAIHRFAHWGPGWFELVLVDPADEARVEIAQAIADALTEYPAIDDEDLSHEEWLVVERTWAHASRRERVAYLQRAQLSIFAARRDDLPADPNGRLFELLAREH